MKKTITAILLFCAPIVEAGPLNWAKHHKRFLFMEGAAIAGASIHAAGLHHCRRSNVEFCDEHYGAAWTAFGFTTGFTVVALPALAEGCWKNEGGKWCNVLAYGGSAAQAGWGIHEFSLGGRHEKMDLH